MKTLKDECVEWIRNWFTRNGPDCNAIVGISGGKDSTVVAALCAEALGKDRVIGVLMPNGEQKDIDDAYKVVTFLGIDFIVQDISSAYDNIVNMMKYPRKGTLEPLVVSKQTRINLPPRIRMTVLYAVAQSLNGRVANTCNLSEEYIGYSTRWGDNVGDFSPLGCLTKTEVVELGIEMGLPNYLVTKTPSDGLCGKTDEDNFGFTYDELDRYITTGEYENEETKEKIDSLYNKNKFKQMDCIPTYCPFKEAKIIDYRKIK